MFTINCVTLGYFYPEYRKFLRELSHLTKNQERILFAIVRRNMRTEFGEEHDFETIRSVEDFKRNVPLCDYEDYAGYIERAKAGEGNILTADEIHLLEPTGGSSAGSKLIPYTRSLEEEYKRGVYPWLADLYLHRPYLLNGRAYWAVIRMTPNILE